MGSAAFKSKELSLLGSHKILSAELQKLIELKKHLMKFI